MTTQQKKPQRQTLGRGLNALFGDDDATPYGLADNTVAPTAASGAPVAAAPRPSARLPVSALTPSPFQPRKVFSTESLAELTASLKQHGMVQPIVVRLKAGTTNQYEIIAGERRWRAAQNVPMHDVPVVIRDIDDKTALEIALIENLQRADLNPLEEAQAFQRLIDEYQYKHDQLATVLGKSRSHITNLLRLLTLPADVQDKLIQGQLTMGHARTLITAANPVELAEQIIKNNLSVRDAEKLASKQKNRVPGTPDKIAKKIAGAIANTNKPHKDADIRALEQNLSAVLGLVVEIDVETNTRGKLVIAYQNLDQLDDVLRRLSR
jgi:ParB family chromosome partitioning protein